jgi:hypothetical protein
MSSDILIELTAEGQGTRKPVKVASPSTCQLADLLKEGKNKFRKKYRFVVYQGEDEGQEERYLRTDRDLRQVLQLHAEQQGTRLRFRLTSSDRPSDDDDDESRRGGALPVIITQQQQQSGRGVVVVVAKEEDTEGGALTQLQSAASLPGCLLAVGMPDLHPGKGIPIGAVIVTRQHVAYPQLVDNDIGCGMSFVETALAAGKFNTNKLRRMADKIRSIDGPYLTQQ